MILFLEKSYHKSLKKAFTEKGCGIIFGPRGVAQPG